MYNLSDINVVKHILRKHEFNFSKGLGQNFIIDKNLCPKIVSDGLVTADMGIVEIGPGIGVLTKEIAKVAKKVVAVEIDSRLIPILNDTLSEFSNVEVINEDFMKIDVNKLINSNFEGMEVGVCSNLPYYITSPIIMKILESNSNIKFMIAMVQKEAAERICAEVGTRECGAISVAVRYYANPKILFDVSKESFVPSPKVDSSVIRLDVDKKNLLTDDEEKTFFKIVKYAFLKRRKTLLNALSGHFEMSKTEIEEIFKILKISLKIRAEELKFDDFINLSKKIR